MSLDQRALRWPSFAHRLTGNAGDRAVIWSKVTVSSYTCGSVGFRPSSQSHSNIGILPFPGTERRNPLRRSRPEWPSPGPHAPKYIPRSPSRNPIDEPAAAAASLDAGAGAGTGHGASSWFKALVFDCDGVILESEDLHRRAYNATFEHFAVRCPGDGRAPVHWSTEFYDVLQNRIGGGKPKMRWYFSKNGWPHSTLFERPPASDEDRAKLIDELQDWKTAKYQQLIGSGSVPPRPGVLELMDEAWARGLLVAVCSAATKSSVVFTLQSLLGKERFERLDCFLAGDDVPRKKPDPIIYRLAAERLGVDASECMVVEDSVIGLQAATGAGMPCIITYTSSTKEQDFSGSLEMFESLQEVTVGKLEQLCLSQGQPVNAI